jgi:hypothetical protein
MGRLILGRIETRAVVPDVVGIRKTKPRVFEQVSDLVVDLEGVGIVQELVIEPLPVSHDHSVRRPRDTLYYMELTTAMLADGAHSVGGKLYVLGGQWDRLFVASFPTQHPALALVLVLRVEYTEALTRVHLKIELTLDGQSCDVGAEARFETGHAPGTVQGAPTFVPIAVPFGNVPFAAPGRYEWVITADGSELGRVPLEVTHGMLAVAQPVGGLYEALAPEATRAAG